MSFMDRTNLAYSTIPSGGAPSPVASGNSLKVASAADRNTFPAAPFMATVWPPGATPTLSNAEIVQINGTSGTDAFVINRGQGGTTAKNIVAGWQIAATITDRPFDDIEAAINQKTFVTIGTAQGADYVCDGSHDESEIQDAINSVASGGTVFMKEGTYKLEGAAIVFNSKRVTLRGSGIDKTIWTMSSSFNGAAFFNDSATTQGAIEISDITFDASGKAGKSFIILHQGDDIHIHDNKFTGQTTPSQWALRFGDYTAGDPEGTASTGLRVYNNIWLNNNSGTSEQLLLVNQRRGFVQNNIFRSNTTSAAYEVVLYINNLDMDVSGNIFETPNSNSIGCQESQRCNIHHNIAFHDASFVFCTIIDSAVINITDNIAECSLTTNTAGAIVFFDRDTGPDLLGAHLVHPTKNILITGNQIKGYKNGLTILTIDATHTMSHNAITIDNNEFTNIVTSIVSFGADNIGNTLSDIHINNNRLYSWTGGGAGAIQLRGYSGDVTQMRNIYIENNYISRAATPSTGAVRAISCTVKIIRNNDFENTAFGFSAISTATGAVIENIWNNLGVDGYGGFTTSTSSTSTSSTSTSSTSTSISTSSTSSSISISSTSISTSSTSHSTSSTSKSTSTSSTSTSTTVIVYS